ncbi:hypothetical protein yc1106_01113 [Curvularia clavata]|uniref:Autophagy-related protein 11 n=1 Tax=Curvularia clavata TaxID=95742 RepID=A0A9Q9DPP0_CURCL|nr:hypothetical protein yc1106_01113 [Curvularia clavata]
MSLQIAVAHTGQRLDADPVAFTSVDALKHWISRTTEIPPEQQVLLTTQGKHVKLQALLTEKEIFVFSRELSNNPQAAISSTPLPDPFAPEDAPNHLANNTDLGAWQALFQARRDWAFGLLEKSHSMSRVASKHFAEQATIERGTQVAVGNHDAHIKGLEQKYKAAKEWYDGVEKEAGDNLSRLDRDFAQLGTVSAILNFKRFLAREMRSAKNIPNNVIVRETLQDFLDVEAVKMATATSQRVRESFGKRMERMHMQLEKIGADYNELLKAVGQSQSRSVVDDTEEPTRLYNEIDAVAKKVESDYEHVMGLEASSKSVAQVSKMALLHTRNFLPAIQEYSIEMSDLVRRAVEQKNMAIRNSVEGMQAIATIESLIASMGADLEQISIPQDGVAAFELISLVGRLPYVYGTLLVEAVRRREWMERMERDTSSLAEEMATFQEEEERRRKRWLKPIADVVNLEAVQGGTLGFEMTVQPEKTVWPTVTREELREYLKDLQRLEGQQSEAEAFSQAIKDLDRPTKQQIKRAKNFKMGSVHEPAFGRGSHLLVRGDDELRILKEGNAKLEEELRGYKSRVRRLEDLVHRQNTVSRLSIGGAPPSFGLPDLGEPSTPTARVASPRPMEENSRRSSISSRRLSTNTGQEDKRRILRLEQELAAEKEARAKLESEAQSRRDDDADQQRRFEEAMSTKNNIMENMRAQQKEFTDERKSLEDEIRAYKARIEEAEDELDRVLGSRDNERTGIDARVQELVAELEQARKEAAEQKTRINEETQALQAEVAKLKAVKTQEHDSLAAAFSHLSPGANVPDDHSALIAQLEDLAMRSLNYQKELEQAVAVAKSDNENAHARLEEQENKFNTKVAEHEKEIALTREEHDAEKAKVASITAQLEEERGHLHDLRSKFAEGETGSEALRKRVEEEEAKVGRLQTELAEKNSHANSLDVELMRAEKKLRKLEEVDSSRTHQRMTRAKDLSQRLYTQHERLIRLLETLGFAITHENGEMILQRASKLGNSTVMADTTAGMSRSTTTPSPTPLKRFLEDIGDLHFLQWTEATSPEEEDKRYQELVSKLNLFNIETFSDAVAKRMRDMEHTARKWQKEARAYRDKAHRFQADSHDKIAYRSFKEGDLALFLPTRNNAHRPWAAFNVGAPHYFLREQDTHRLGGKEWLVARISKVEERVVDLSKTLDGAPRASLDDRSVASSNAVSFEDDNPFELSDGLRWYLLEATEEKAMAPGTPGIKGAVTVKSSLETGQGEMQKSKKKASMDPATQLGKSLDSRRSSGTSKKSAPLAGKNNSAEALSPGERPDSHPNSAAATRGGSPAGAHGPSHLRESHTNGTEVDKTADDGNGGNVRDLLWGP